MTTLLGVSLAGRRVVVVGGAAGTARRIERFVRDGARVAVYAPRVASEVETLIRAHALPWVRRLPRARDLRGTWLVHAASGDRRTDARIAALCEQRQILCINASAATHGTARLAAETRSGDVVVGAVSDSGADPRRAARVRNAIGELLDRGALPVRRRRSSAPGRVDLVGGGPGPIDLLTIRGRRLIAEADVIVADRLGPVDVLKELEPDVEVIDVGKRPGSHPVPQEEINALLVSHARAGKRVVRLKGGDSFVFGRGGEEVRACHEAGVPVEVVPGLTSAVSVPQAAGIPVLHRGTASQLYVMHGHGEVTEAALEAMRQYDVTCVILMGVAEIPRLAATALAAGVPADRPVAIVEAGHTPRQRTTRTTLGKAASDAAAAGVANPAVIVIGHVAREGLLYPQPSTNAHTLAGDTHR
ncbi:uroporphyrinogen-III C-methyltransferase [Microbacterium sp. C7(2022)]|uniref:uroporphyrinogen-III C-methyltransferase n=1 Tax=Microbacterium sp. C7(2022) TaxID=2992759 RepID=UPI00237A922B|nr:uroporphyrinogen-III C-methyltransferase [Microbacterium sp. C7(2022)]MDE0546900.1 uroporphyrinogen-III C-methyltransferase [Microbacterium sp. C7(2022)]